MGDLPAGVLVRAPRWEELEAVVELIRECEVADEGGAEMTVDDVRSQWTRGRFDLKRDAWIVLTGDGRFAGYVDVWARTPRLRFLADGYVHPQFRGGGIGTFLVRAAEARARSTAKEPVATVSHFILHGDEAAQRLLIGEGYAVGQHYWRMVMRLTGALEPPAAPRGARIRTFVPGEDDRAVWALIQEAFSDNRDYSTLPFAEWAALMLDRESFDPTLYFVAESEAGDVVGVALCPRYEEHGWVRQFAVARDWRRRGLGKALMQTVFAEFYARGRREVALVTDSYNRTGARLFYESLGMRVERQHDRWEKELGAKS
jgi:mycothiol synthase